MRLLTFMALVAAIFLSPRADASFVLDSFTGPFTQNSTDTLISGAVSLTRTNSGFDGATAGSPGIAGGTANVTYTVTGGTFNDLTTFAGAGFTHPFTTFTLDTSIFKQTTATIVATWGAQTVTQAFANLTNGSVNHSFVFGQFSSLGNATSISFDVISDNKNVALTGLVATPEPTSLAMFGLVAGGGFFARRRVLKKKLATA